MGDPAPPSSVRPLDLVGEAMAGITQRPVRTVLTVLGTVLGIGTLVAVLGLTNTAGAQISSAFSVLKATELTIVDDGAVADESTVYSFPGSADECVAALNGVKSAGRTWLIPGGETDVTTSLDPRSARSKVSVYAASAGYLRAAGSAVEQGVLFDAFHEDKHVALLGPVVARQLRISSVDIRPTIFIRGTGFSVIGILAGVDRDPGILSEVLIPSGVALRDYGSPLSFSPARMLVSTQLGAAGQVAQEAPMALRPDAPQLLRTEPLQDASALEGTVSTAFSTLFYILAAITLFIGATSIANTTLVSVMERTREIGLRRSLGARRRDVVSQFLIESSALGLLGGLVGTALGTVVVVVVSLSLEWSALVDPVTTSAAPLLGTLAGLVSGAYPAHRASLIEPLAALRR